MMDITLLLRGLVLGFSIAAPVGPIGVLCIRRTLINGRLAGLLSGLGAATADGIYGCIAGFGLTFMADFFIDHRVVLRLLGGTFLCYLGVQTLRSQPPDSKFSDFSSPLSALKQTETDSPYPPVPSPLRQRLHLPRLHLPRVDQSLVTCYGSTLFLTLTNPMTILAFAAVFAGLGLANLGGNYGAAMLLVTGVFLGSAVWWLFLSTLVNLFRARLNFARLRSLNQISGVVLLAFGMLAWMER